MKKEIKMFLGLAALLIATLSTAVMSQYESADIIVRGSYIQVRKITASSTTATALFPVDSKRIDGMCRVNGVYTVWVGTVSATRNNITHDNITTGFPLFQYDIYRLDGQLTGIQYATCDIGTASCDIRCIDGMVR